MRHARRYSYYFGIWLEFVSSKKRSGNLARIGSVFNLRAQSQNSVAPNKNLTFIYNRSKITDHVNFTSLQRRKFTITSASGRHKTLQPNLTISLFLEKKSNPCRGTSFNRSFETSITPIPKYSPFETMQVVPPAAMSTIRPSGRQKGSSIETLTCCWRSLVGNCPYSAFPHPKTSPLPLEQTFVSVG